MTAVILMADNGHFYIRYYSGGRNSYLFESNVVLTDVTIKRTAITTAAASL